MQAEENEITSPEAGEPPEPEITGEPVDIYPETEQPADPEPQLDQPPEESRFRGFFRKALRWTLGFLIVFGLGYLAAIFSLYNPKVEELNQSQGGMQAATNTIQELEDQITGLQTKIADSNTQIATLEGKIEILEAQNQASAAEQARLNLHISILKARADVNSAQVELYEGNPSQARILLQNTDQTLSTMESLLPDDLKSVVAPLRIRLELALSGIENAPETAIMDLDIMAGDLFEIQNTLFGN